MQFPLRESASSFCVQVARESDFGKNNSVFLCRTHLGRFLQPGDVALGYDLARFVNTDDNLEACIRSGYQAPDVVLVKKCFDDVRAKRRAQQRPRNYKLRLLEKEREDAGNAHAKRMETAEAQRQEDLEQFMNVRLSSLISKA
jgi:nonsense-mediated mRNA decay protein 3